MTEGVATVMLRLDAPFAAWRWLQAGVFRGTFPVIPHSAAWGLALNIAGIETRGNLSEVVTPIRSDAPFLDIAVGLIVPGYRSTVYQQLHSYPVGNSGAEFKERTFGNKYWIKPARREVMVDVVAVVGVRGLPDLVERIPRGLAGDPAIPHYGLPFAGDNQYLFSRIDVVDAQLEADWYIPLQPGEAAKDSTRLTTNIDRGDSSRTVAPLFYPSRKGMCPEASWVSIGPAVGQRSS
jgi:CRISPR-associated protein Cas5t